MATGRLSGQPLPVVRPTCISYTRERNCPRRHESDWYSFRINVSVPSSNYSFYINNNLTLLSHKITFPCIFVEFCKIICIISRDFFCIFRGKGQQRILVTKTLLMIPLTVYLFYPEISILVNDFSPSGEHMLGFSDCKSKKFVNHLYHMFVILMV